MLFSLCSIVSKILAHVFESLLVFILFKFKKCPNISYIQYVYIQVHLNKLECRGKVHLFQ